MNREVVRITVPASKRIEAEEMLKNDDLVIAHRVTTEVEAVDGVEVMESPKLDLKEDVTAKFVEFLNTSPDLNYPLENYLAVVAELSKKEELV